ncbi:MAG: hypothetical protein [Arizlama microvirus]|nr:MAG: hypothetical protein [Arizlama microvirus]
MNVIKQYIINILYSVDQFANTILCGDPDETISSRLGKLKRACGGQIPWAYPICKTVDWFLEKIDNNHTLEAIEDQVGKREIIKFKQINQKKKEEKK